MGGHPGPVPRARVATPALPHSQPLPTPPPVLRRITTALAGVASSITAVNRNVSVSLAGKADSNVHMWTGGCANHGPGGWHEYCLNQAHMYGVVPLFSFNDSFLYWGIGYTRHLEVTGAVVVGFSRTGDGHNHGAGRHLRTLLTCHCTTWGQTSKLYAQIQIYNVKLTFASAATQCATAHG